MRNHNFSFLSLLTILFCASCTSGNRAQPIDPPSAALATATQDATDPIFESSTEWIPQEWWTIFNDEQLTSFILTTFKRNPTLQAATSNIYLAKSVADRARSTLFPNINWNGDVSRQKFSETGIIPFNPNPPPVAPAAIAATGGVAGIPVYFTQTETEAILTYDFDVWGKNRNNWAAAIGDMRAQIADRAFTQLELGIAVAKVYYQLQIDYQRQEIAEALVENQTQYAVLVKQRVADNLDNRQSFHTSKSNLASAKQMLLQIQADIAVNEYQLKAYLAGDFEENICNINITQQPLPKVPMPTDVPVHLISHRPDIIAQLWLIESAGKQIEVAKAGFYPDFNIAALFGYQTIHFEKLFQWRSSYFNVDPAFSLPIFEGGRLIANLRNSEVNYDLAILHYNELILNAARDILDGIAILRNADQQLQELKKRQAHQEEVFNLTNLRMEHNLSSKLDYLQSEQNLLLARDQEVVAYGNTLQAILALIKALGGGYEEG